ENSAGRTLLPADYLGEPPTTKVSHDPARVPEKTRVVPEQSISSGAKRSNCDSETFRKEIQQGGRSPTGALHFYRSTGRPSVRKHSISSGMITLRMR
ncbi:MAG: hypothetical protein R3Y19_02750, partial [Rikenellaceae bacterium]